MKIRSTALLIAVAAARLLAAVPTPASHFGFTPGDERKLFGYRELVGYYEKLAASSDRIVWREFGRTSQNKPMYMAFISDAANLKRLDEYGEINRKLALATVNDAEARDLAAKGKAFVWIDSGLHASEVAPTQQAPELAYRMLTGESEETRRIRRNVILIQVPSINPDGLDMIVDWYHSNLGTPYELAPLPRLYHQYAGHDNNRDWYMLNLRETRNVTAQLFQQWFPHIVYNQHQSPPFPARIFVPPYAEPLNPNIPAAVMEGINWIGTTMRERFALAGQSGVLSYWGFDGWWNGGLRSAPAFHNMHGILTETAGFAFGNSKEYDPAKFPARFANGMPTKEPAAFYTMPWMGGKWGVRNAIDYMLTADFAILNLAAGDAEHFLYKAFQTARANIVAGEKGGPFAYVVAADAADQLSAKAMLWRLQYAGVRVSRARQSFETAGRTFPAGSIVIPAAQPFRGYLVDLMEPQRFPEIRQGSGGAVKRPYDIAGWTLPYQMGVPVERVDAPLALALEDLPLDVSANPSKDHRDNGFFLHMADLAKSGARVRWNDKGELAGEGERAAWEFRQPRVGLYEPWVANSDTGWTDWMLTTFRVPHAALHNADIQKGGLRDRFDTIILASQTAASILRGIRDGERSRGGQDELPNVQRPEYAGGIELAGVVELEKFVKEGGTLIAFDASTELPVQQFALPVRLLVRSQDGGRDSDSPSGYFCPGSILRLKVDTTNPIAFGMPETAYAFSAGGQAFESSLAAEYNRGENELRTIASYASKGLLASGWIGGEQTIVSRPALVEVRHGAGKVVLFGFRPQHRGQTYGTFRLILNAVWLGSAKAL